MGGDSDRRHLGYLMLGEETPAEVAADPASVTGLYLTRHCGRSAVTAAS